MLKIYKGIKRWVAERLFETELDEDYLLGIGEGQRAYKATLQLQVKMLQDQGFKKDQPGLDKVMALLDDESWYN